MTTNVRATCSDCGDIRTTIDKVVVRLPDGWDDTHEGAEYRFLCPECRKIVLKSAGQEIVSVLISAGVAVEFFTYSLELMERPTEDAAAPITLDDLIDFGLDIEDEEAWMRRLLGGTGTSE